MAVTDAYETAANYRAAIDKTDTAEDAEILADLTAISRYIEQRLGRFFTKDASAVVRTFMPRSSGVATRPDWAESENPWKYGGLTRTLHIDDLVSATSIKIDEDRDGLFSDETALAATDYELLPRNADKGPEPRPYNAIELTAWGTKMAFPPLALVEVTGVWGWPAVPEAIKRATIQLTAILRLETPRAQATVSELGQLVQMSPQASGIVNELMRHYGKVSL